MYIEHPHILAKKVPEKWYAHYKNKKDYIYEQLLKEGENLTPKSVASIIGNSSWTSTSCNECGTQDVLVVVLGQEPDYESSTAWVCLDCLKKAVVLCENTLEQNPEYFI